MLQAYIVKRHIKLRENVLENKLISVRFTLKHINFILIPENLNCQL